MSRAGENRFENFFSDGAYVALKNHLYNYLLRRRAVRNKIGPPVSGITLELGSGLSPMIDPSAGVVHLDLSFTALRALRATRGEGSFVVADAARLPFRAGSLARVVCSEVVEHLPDDRPAIREIASALAPGGSLVLTFPHRRAYFALDDRFVHHYRRYDEEEMVAKLREAGLETAEIEKVLGPLEKVTMIAVVSLLGLDGRREASPDLRRPITTARWFETLFRWINRLYCLPVLIDARLSPRRIAAVLLLRAVRREPHAAATSDSAAPRSGPEGGICPG